MTTDEALNFLRSHQPLPPTSEVSNELLRRLDEVRRHFAENPDERCVGLLLNAFGKGDGHGVYQLIEDAILAHDKEVVIPALQQSLLNRAGSVRYWSAQIAANYPDPELVTPLVRVLTEGDLDERLAAVTALEGIQIPEAGAALEKALQDEQDFRVQNLIREVLGK
jgi:HEAT repeat protein